MDYAIVAAETVSAIVMIIIGYAIIIEKNKKLSQNFFVGCILSVFVVLFCDAISYVFEGMENLTLFLYIDNFMTIFAGDVLMFFFAWYVWSIVNEKSPIKKTLVYIVTFLSFSDMIFQIYGVITHSTFEIVNGTFTPGPYYDVCFYIQLIVLLLCMIHLIIYRKILGTKTLIFFGLYYLLPVVSIFLIIIDPQYSFICSSIAISFLVIYIGIEKESKDLLMSRLVHTDILTGLLNRNAYQEKIEYYSTRAITSNIGVIFSDVNGLKYVNDNYGHSKGDELIVNYSNILSELFSPYLIYRISGDEFVVIISDVDFDSFMSMFNKLKENVLEKNFIASCGYSYGKNTDIGSLILQAEKLMYSDKSTYYEKYGEDRRRIKIEKGA